MGNTGQSNSGQLCSSDMGINGARAGLPSRWVCVWVCCGGAGNQHPMALSGRADFYTGYSGLQETLNFSLA